MARISLAILTILAVATLVFFGMHLIEGSYEELFFPLASPEERQILAARYGLDEPLLTQYVVWLGNAVQGDFGMSLATRRPVLDELLRRLPLTLELGLIALAFIVCIGIPCGILAGLFFRSRLSQAGRIGAMLMMSVPDFVLASFCVWLFSSYSLWFRVGGWVPLSEGLAANLQYGLLPGFVLSLTGLGIVLATTRSSVLQVMAHDHVLAALSRGLGPGATLRRHILRNAVIPILTLFAIVAGYVLGGAVLVETVFNLDGVGRFLVNAIASRDYPVVQAGVIFAASVFVLLNLVTDLLYSLIDPRIRK